MFALSPERRYSRCAGCLLFHFPWSFCPFELFVAYLRVDKYNREIDLSLIFLLKSFKETDLVEAKMRL
jgi:hypothetical protein